MRSGLAKAAGLAGVSAAAILVFACGLEGGASPPEVEAFFSPGGGAARAISREIRKARSTLDVAMYLLTAPKLASSVISASKRGVKVRVILDKRQAGRWSQLENLKEAGVPVWLVEIEKEKDDPSDPQFHNKYAVIDGKTVITGSYNWTVMADERNFENLLILRNDTVAAKYAEAFERAMEIAKPAE